MFRRRTVPWYGKFFALSGVLAGLIWSERRSPMILPELMAGVRRRIDRLVQPRLKVLLERLVHRGAGRGAAREGGA